jgi:hypothetical protein
MGLLGERSGEGKEGRELWAVDGEMKSEAGFKYAVRVRVQVTRRSTATPRQRRMKWITEPFS